ncbi:MAG: UDP-3-O-(3-hydroxymyristoyl)glucosamine N-acyltransferase [Pseudohongiellaceae bacterium]
MADEIKYSLGELADLLQVDLVGSPDEMIGGMASLSSASTGHLSFFNNPLYLRELPNTKASAVILSPEYADKCSCNRLLSTQPYITYAKASQLFMQRHKTASGIHPSAIVHTTAVVAASARIGPHVVVEAGAQIEANTEISANCVIGAGSIIGAQTLLFPNVTIYEGVSLGRNCILHSGVVIGADGFGFAPDEIGHTKIAQLGGVSIGDGVEIGACSSIDRGALDDTIIENGVKIDNQVQIAHNVKIGANTVICGCSAIAGSSTIGKNCIIAGGVGIINHLNIADGVTVTAMSLVNQSIDKAGVYSSGTGLTDTASWKRNALRFKELDKMEKRLRRLEQDSRKK